MTKMKYRLYRICRPIIKFIMKLLYRVEIINSEAILKEGGCLLAGNHKHNLDCWTVISATKRTVRFLGKIELFQKYGWLFRNLGVIPVDRKKKNKEAMKEAETTLKNNEMIGIFPEGTFNDTEYLLRPFKMGAVKLASDTGKPIVPFAIIGEYKLFRKSIKIVFGKPYYVKNTDLVKENNHLMNRVIKLMEENNEKK